MENFTIWIKRFDISKIFGEGLSCNSKRISMEISSIKKCAHHYRNTAHFIDICHNKFSKWFEISK